MSKEELVKKIAAKLATAELGLFKARTALRDLEGLVMEGRKLDMVGGDECMRYVNGLANLYGMIAAVEGNVYPIHAEFTEIAKAQGVDPGGIYVVLQKYMPETEVKSGGGRR